MREGLHWTCGIPSKLDDKLVQIKKLFEEFADVNLDLLVSCIEKVKDQFNLSPDYWLISTIKEEDQEPMVSFI